MTAMEQEAIKPTVWACLFYGMSMPFFVDFEEKKHYLEKRVISTEKIMKNNTLHGEGLSFIIF